MPAIQDGLEVLKSTGDPHKLHKALKHAPKHVEKPHPLSNDNRGPIHPVESFDNVTVAWHKGEISDDQYAAAQKAVAGKL